MHGASLLDPTSSSGCYRWSGTIHITKGGAMGSVTPRAVCAGARAS